MAGERPLRELDGEIEDFRNADGSLSRGVVFECPMCASGHGIAVNWSGPSILTTGARWKLESAEDVDWLTLSPSINCDTGGTCKFHGWVRNGKVVW